MDRYPWDEADTKIKSLLYLSIGQEGTRQYHQNNPHTNIDTCSTYEFAHELAITFTKPRNTTYDRFQIINARQEPHQSLETFYSRLRELGAKAAFGGVEQDLVKDFFIGKMNNTAIQMELLSEMRTPAQALNYALARERGQQNQKEILRGNNSTWNTTVAHLSARKTKPAILPTPQKHKTISTMLEMRRIVHTKPQQQLSSKNLTMQYMQKTRTLRKNVSFTDTITTRKQRTVPTTTISTNKKCQKHHRGRGRNYCTTTRRRERGRNN